jgi:hypothetical protein
VELASHERAAAVQRLAELGWLPNQSFFYGVFVAGKIASSRSLSASRAITDSATAAKRAHTKPVYKSAGATTESISRVSTGSEIMQTGNVRIVTARQGTK